MGSAWAGFMISLATMWLRTGPMPRWLAVVSYGLALTLLGVINLSLWVTLLFPAWALAVSTLLPARRPARPGHSVAAARRSPLQEPPLGGVPCKTGTRRRRRAGQCAPGAVCRWTVRQDRPCT